jgi:hypothetical protein
MRIFGEMACIYQTSWLFFNAISSSTKPNRDFHLSCVVADLAGCIYEATAISIPVNEKAKSHWQ